MTITLAAPEGVQYENTHSPAGLLYTHQYSVQRKDPRTGASVFYLAKNTDALAAQLGANIYRILGYKVGPIADIHELADRTVDISAEEARQLVDVIAPDAAAWQKAALIEQLVSHKPIEAESIIPPDEKWQAVDVVIRRADNGEFALVDGEQLHAGTVLMIDESDSSNNGVYTVNATIDAEAAEDALDLSDDAADRLLADVLAVERKGTPCEGDGCWMCADTADDLDGVGIVELRKLAKPHKIKGAWTMKSDELREAIRARRG